MQQTSKSLALAGVAMVGASVIAVTPGAGGGGDFPGLFFSPREVTLDVALTADSSALGDLLAPWIDQYDTAAQNATTLIDNFHLAPAVGLQQFLVNQSDLWREFLSAPTSSTLASVFQEFQTNLDDVLSGISLQGTSIGSFNEVAGWSAGSIGQLVLQHTMIGSHALLFGEVPGYLPASEAGLVGPIVDFLGSPDSAILMGNIGPFIAPWVALGNSIGDGDSFNEILANTVGAFFNGADLNLDGLVPAINELATGHFPPGMTISELDIAFGGLLSTGSVQISDYVAADGTEIPAVGGSIFNSVGLEFTDVPVVGTLTLTSEPVGPIAAWETLSQTIGALLGSGWADPTAYVGSGLYGSPYISLDVTAPLFGSYFSTLLNDVFGESAGSAATAAAAELSTLVQDVVSLF